MKKFGPTLWLSFGLATLTLALALTGYVLGLMPDGYRAELDARAKVAEALAVQLADAANRNDTVTLENTISSVVERNDDVFSAALRKADGEIVLSAGDHATHWVDLEEGKSTPTHVAVPLQGKEGLQGTIELSFGPASNAKRILGVPATLLAFMGFLAAAGMFAYFMLLRRALKQLDPSRVIPERVQKAFDTLAEGVIIIDERERIMMVNRAFATMHDGHADGTGPAIGTKINQMAWRMVDGRALAGGYPWYMAVREGKERSEDALSLRTLDGNVHTMRVSATVIANEKEKPLGAIVTLNDMTVLNRSEDRLARTKETLTGLAEREKQLAIELEFHETRDPVSGCLRRRVWFDRLRDMLEAEELPVSVLSIDLDDFGALNRAYGHSAGDRLLVAVGKSLDTTIGEQGAVSRFSADQFCIALPATDSAKSALMAQTLRDAIAACGEGILPNDVRLTASIGIAAADARGFSAHALLDRAEEATQTASVKGGDRIVDWVSGIAAKRTVEDPRPATPAPTVAETTSGFGYTAYMNGLTSAVANARRNGRKTAALQISIDSWGYLSEALGDKASGSLLQAVRRRIKQALRQGDDVMSVANTGSLFVTVNDFDTLEKLEWIAAELTARMRAPFAVSGQDIYLATSMGIASYPDDGGKASILIANAAAAMRRACDDHVAEGYRFYSADMSRASRDRLNIEAGIREALERNEFLLNFQPIVDLQTGALSAAECLLRCSNERLKGVYMDAIIDTAEQSSLIAQIDDFVLKTALAQMQAWDEAGLHLPKISINISANQLTDRAFMDGVFEQIAEAPFAASRVQIEVTETARLDDVSVAAEQLKRLQQLGVLIALDDFGTGQASLTYLQRLHPDVIKIDRSFITGVHTNHANATLVSAMTVMA
ncbi:MAG: EAL domain-containing protein, partial [Pseudomonadota bacterium]